MLPILLLSSIGGYEEINNDRSWQVIWHNRSMSPHYFLSWFSKSLLRGIKLTNGLYIPLAPLPVEKYNAANMWMQFESLKNVKS